MFRTVSLSIIRSFSLYAQQWYMSYRCADSLRACCQQTLYDIQHFCVYSENSTGFGQFLCPSSGDFHCAHSIGICHTGLLTAWAHAVSKTCMTYNIVVCTVKKSTCFGQFLCPTSGVFTVHTAMVYVIQVCWQLERMLSAKPVWHITLLSVQWEIPDDGQRSCPKNVEFYSKNKFEKLVHLAGFSIRILYV